LSDGAELEHSPGLPLCMREQRHLYVVEEDLRELVWGSLRGWAERHRTEAKRMGRRTGMVPTAYLLMRVLQWCRENVGVGLQVRADFWAELLACDRSHVYRALHQVDPGMSGRYRRRRGSKRTSGGGRAPYAQHIRRQVKLEHAWVDAQGKSHGAADIRAVTLATDLGVAALRPTRAIRSRRKWVRAGRPLAVSKALQELRRELRKVATAVRARVENPVGRARSFSPLKSRARASALQKETPSKGAKAPLEACSRPGGGCGGNQPLLATSTRPPGQAVSPSGTSFGQHSAPPWPNRPAGPWGRGAHRGRGDPPLLPENAPAPRTEGQEAMDTALMRGHGDLRALTRPRRP